MAAALVIALLYSYHGNQDRSEAMSSVIWQSWPGITMKESQRLLKFFASKDDIVYFKSSRKHIVGLSGQGIVVFRNKDTASSLIQAAEGQHHELDLSHVFTDSTDEASSTTTNSDAKGRAWKVALRDANKSPAFIHMESSMIRRRNRVNREHNFMTKYSKFLTSESVNSAVDSKLNPNVAQFLTDLWQRKKAELRQVERFRSAKKSTYVQMNQSNASEDQAANVSSNEDSSSGTADSTTQDSTITEPEHEDEHKPDDETTSGDSEPSVPGLTEQSAAA